MVFRVANIYQDRKQKPILPYSNAHPLPSISFRLCLWVFEGSVGWIKLSTHFMIKWLQRQTLNHRLSCKFLQRLFSLMNCILGLQSSSARWACRALQGAVPIHLASPYPVLTLTSHWCSSDQWGQRRPWGWCVQNRASVNAWRFPRVTERTPVQGQAEPERTLNRKVKISGCWASEGHRMSTVRATAVEVVITTVIYWALSICQVPSIELMFSPHNYGRDQIHLFFPLATQTPFPSLPCRWNNQVTGFQVWWNLHSF